MVELSRRGFLAAGVTAAAGAVLTACVGSGNSGSGSSGGDSNTITWWSSHPGKSTDVEKELITRFQQANPSLTVQLVDGGKNYEEVAQKFNAALSGGAVMAGQRLAIPTQYDTVP